MLTGNYPTASLIMDQRCLETLKNHRRDTNSKCVRSAETPCSTLDNIECQPYLWNTTILTSGKSINLDELIHIGGGNRSAGLYDPTVQMDMHVRELTDAELGALPLWPCDSLKPD